MTVHDRRMIRVFLGTVVLAAIVLGGALTASATQIRSYPGVPIFDVPTVHAAEQRIRQEIMAGLLDRATREIDGLEARYPNAPLPFVLRALLAARQNRNQAVVAAMLEAHARGAANLGPLLEDTTMAPFVQDPRLADLRPRYPTVPAPDAIIVRHAEAVVLPRNAAWDEDRNQLVTRLIFPQRASARRFRGQAGSATRRLNRLIATGHAAGSYGDAYDNRDRLHSTLPRQPDQQLTHIVYGSEAVAASVDYGPNLAFDFGVPTFGNSSTAHMGPLWRSQARFLLTMPGGPERLWQQYTSNHIYVFPEHRDHDPSSDKSGHGDVFPAQTPYMLVSQGSSGSDRPILMAIQVALAALRPEVKSRLISRGLIAPTVQMLFRRAQMGIEGDADYLSPEAHPTVFDGRRTDYERLVDLAQAITLDKIPPRAGLKVMREKPKDRLIFADAMDERLFDTPGAVARAWRGGGTTRSYELLATADGLSSGAVKFHWRIIRGNPEAIRIAPQTGDDARVRLEIDHAAWRGGSADLRTPRVDIAVFADNGAALSAPVFFSLLFPAHQAREVVGDRLVAVQHAVSDAPYSDPQIWPDRDWTDRFDYDASGRVSGWVRVREGQETRFSAHGYRVLTTDAKGRPETAQKVRYQVKRANSNRLAVSERAHPRRYRYRYRYRDEADRIGLPIPMRTGE